MFLKQSILPLEKASVISSIGRRYFKNIFVKEKKSFNLQKKPEKTEIKQRDFLSIYSFSDCVYSGARSIKIQKSNLKKLKN